MPRKRAPAGSPTVPPSSEGLSWDDAMALLDRMEGTFVRALLRGESVDDSAMSAGWTGTGFGVQVLGRPHVRRALLALAPLLAVDAAGEAIARRILRPYAVARMAGLLEIRGQNGLAAARDLLDVTGDAADADRVRRAWEARQARRTGPADNGRYGNPPATPRPPSA